MQTSIATYHEAPATVRFRRWTAFGGTAYMANQIAGFSVGEAEVLERHGRAVIIRRAGHPAGMVTK